MGPQYQATQDAFAASPQASDPNQVQTAGNQTLGKSMEQSPVHDGFGTRSAMYDNGMDVSAQPAPVSQPPQPQNQPRNAGVDPSWAQQPRKRGGRTKRADGGNTAYVPGTRVDPGAVNAFNPSLGSPTGLAAFNAPTQYTGFSDAPLAAFGSMYNQPNSLMMTGDTLNRMASAGMLSRPSPNQDLSVMQQSANQGQAGNEAQPAIQLPKDVRYQSDYQDPVANLYATGMTNEDFVNALYSKDLNRAPDTAGQQYWIDELKSGRRGQQEVENAFLKSPEANKNFITQLYQSDLGRNPEQAGFDYWNKQLNEGAKTRAQAETDFLNSPEGISYQLGQGVLPEKSGSVDPFVAQYNAAINNAQNIYGNLAQQNLFSSQAQKAAYDTALADLQKSGSQRLSDAQTLKEQQDQAAAEQERQRQQQLLLLLLSSQNNG